MKIIKIIKMNYKKEKNIKKISAINSNLFKNLLLKSINPQKRKNNKNECRRRRGIW
jgi:hypothetical protein